jgi:hypothetical protein
MVILGTIIFTLAMWAVTLAAGLSALTASVATITATILISALAAQRASRYLLMPLGMLWQAILHVAPDSHNMPAPQLQKLRLGHQLVTSLAARVYQFASQQGRSRKFD